MLLPKYVTVLQIATPKRCKINVLQFMKSARAELLHNF